MKTYIALLRGINVSGQNKIPMLELRVLLSNEGLTDVQTYIQSGNIIFKSSEEDISYLELTINRAIKKHFGFDVPVIIKSRKGLQQIFDDCPFNSEKKTHSYFMILYSVADKTNIDELLEIEVAHEEFVITDYCVYFYCFTGYGKAKCNNNFFERKLKVTSTARNYKTMVKLMAMSALNEKDH